MSTLLHEAILTRIWLAFLVPPESLQPFLPPDWRVAQIAEPHAQGGNLVMLFNDLLLHRSEEDPGPSMVDLRLGFTTRATNPKAPESDGSTIAQFRMFTANPKSLAEGYRVGFPVLARISREAWLKSVGLDTTVTESVRVETDQGGVELSLQYSRGLPTRRTSERWYRSTNDLSRRTLYQEDELVDVVKSVPLGVDRLQVFQLRVTIPDLARLFNGAELISMIAIPWHVRRAFAP